MRVRERGSTLEVHETPVLFWLFGLLFVFGGLVFFLGPLGLFQDAGRIRWWLRIVISAFGAIAVGVGVWQLLGAPRSRLVIDRSTRRVRMDRVGLRGRSSEEWSVDSIAAVELLEDRDDEGNPIFKLRLFLRDAEPVAISPLWSHGRERLEEVARAVSASVGAATLNVRTNPTNGSLQARERHRRSIFTGSIKRNEDDLS